MVSWDNVTLQITVSQMTPTWILVIDFRNCYLVSFFVCFLYQMLYSVPMFILVDWIGYDGMDNIAGPVHWWLTGLFLNPEKDSKDCAETDNTGKKGRHQTCTHKHNSSDNEWRRHPIFSSSIWKMVCPWQWWLIQNQMLLSLAFLSLSH